MAKSKPLGMIFKVLGFFILIFSVIRVLINITNLRGVYWIGFLLLGIILFIIGIFFD